MAPSAKTAAEKPSPIEEPQSKKRAIELVDVEENAESEVQAKFKKFRKYLEDGGAYESLAKVHAVFFIRDVGKFQLVMTHKFYPNLTSFVSYDVS